MTIRFRATAASLALALSLATLAPAGGAVAASPAPASTSGVEAWLDASPTLPPDMSPGATFTVALTTWGPEQHAFVPLDGVFARLHPAKGKAAPTTADAAADGPGHLVIGIEVPIGGPGKLEFGVHGPDGDKPLKLAGIGPPADAAIGELVQARLQDIVGDVVAGRPFPLAVSLAPLGWWDYAALRLPDQLIVSAAHPGGPELASTELLPDGAGAPFAGHLTIPETGDIELTALIPGENGQPDSVVAGPAMPVHVIEGGVRLDGTTPRPDASGAPAGVAPPQAPAPAGEGNQLPVVWIGLVGLLVLAGVLVFGGTVRGWLRRED